MKAIEKFQRDFKTHRCALDFDSKFCASLAVSSNEK